MVSGSCSPKLEVKSSNIDGAGEGLFVAEGAIKNCLCSVFLNVFYSV
jgi:hypothetical protein